MRAVLLLLMAFILVVDAAEGQPAPAPKPPERGGTIAERIKAAEDRERSDLTAEAATSAVAAKLSIAERVKLIEDAERASLIASAGQGGGGYSGPNHFDRAGLESWGKSAELIFCLIFVLLTMFVIGMITCLRPKVDDPSDALRLVVLPMVICIAVCLLVIGYNQEQINVVMPFLGMIAGHLLAKLGTANK